MKEFRCNGEVLEVKNGDEWEYVIDCCESLSYTAERILDACGINYVLDDEYEDDDDDEE